MNHFVLHDAADTVAVVVVEGVKAGMELNGWIMDDNRHIKICGFSGQIGKCEIHRAIEIRTQQQVFRGITAETQLGRE